MTRLRLARLIARDWSTLLARLIRYGLVGILGTILHMGTLVLLVEVFTVAVVPASVAGFLLALAVSFLLNRHWVFGVRQRPLRAAFRYTVVSLTGLGLNVVIMTLVVHWLQWWYVWGIGLVIVVVTTVNFTLNQCWSFARQG